MGAMHCKQCVTLHMATLNALCPSLLSCSAVPLYCYKSVELKRQILKGSDDGV
jgi:hypothetical protein